MFNPELKYGIEIPAGILEVPAAAGGHRAYIKKEMDKLSCIERKEEYGVDYGHGGSYWTGRVVISGCRRRKGKICTALKIAAILAGILIYYLAEYRDIHRLYIPYAVIVWGIWYYFKEEYSWEKWIDREIIHFPYATHKERMEVINSVPRFDYDMTRKFMQSVIYSLENLSEEELQAICDCTFSIPYDHAAEWEKL